MESKEFVEKFANQFDDTDITEFSIDTKFRELDEWSSMTSLMIIAMVNESYGVKLTGDDIKESTTIEDIFNIVKSRK